MQSQIFNNYPTANVLDFNRLTFVGGECFMSENDEYKRTAPRVTVPEPEITNEKKFKCPIDQEVYDNREDYESHCKEEHDVL
jgi:hypothetical protein